MVNRLPILFIIILCATACSSVAVSNQSIASGTKGQTAEIPITGQDQFSQCGGPFISPQNADFEQAVITQTNQFRKAHQLPPLKHVPQLDAAARYHAADMNENNYFNHNSFHPVNGQLTLLCDPWQRIEAFYDGWNTLGENIAAGQTSPEMAMDGWLNSPEHLKNILDPNYWEIGVGYYHGNGTYGDYWDQDFGRREQIYPLVINEEAAITASDAVTLYIYGSWEQIRLRNDANPWSDWQPFQNHMQWHLPSERTLHVVSAEMRRKGNNATAQDSIMLK